MASVIPANATNTESTSILSKMSIPLRDLMPFKATMFNFKLPSDRSMYESSLIYCNLCDYSCDLIDKNAIIGHYLGKHPDDNIVYSYLWPQMEQNPSTGAFKVKYYFIKAHLKIRTKQDQNKLVFPTTLLTEFADNPSDSNDTNVDDEAQFIMSKMLDWLEINSSKDNEQNESVSNDDAPELEEEQDIAEVEMYGEDAYEYNAPLIESINPPVHLDELVKLVSTASTLQIQQKTLSYSSSMFDSSSFTIDNVHLSHLLAINKSENIFRVKQIHDYYGGCFICGKQVDFNMKHYQVFILFYFCNFNIILF
jgi:hypothetical protein